MRDLEAAALEAFKSFQTNRWGHGWPSRADGLEAYADNLLGKKVRAGGVLGRITFLREVVREREDVISDLATNNCFKERCLLRTLKRLRGEEGIKFLKPLPSIATLQLILSSTPPGRYRGQALIKFRALFKNWKINSPHHESLLRF